jgi:hypothetical protein
MELSAFSQHVRELMEAQQYAQALSMLCERLKERDSNLYQVGLTQKALLQEMHDEVAHGKLPVSEAEKGKLRIRGAVNYILNRLQESEEEGA